MARKATSLGPKPSLLLGGGCLFVFVVLLFCFCSLLMKREKNLLFHLKKVILAYFLSVSLCFSLAFSLPLFLSFSLYSYLLSFFFIFFVFPLLFCFSFLPCFFALASWKEQAQIIWLGRFLSSVLSVIFVPCRALSFKFLFLSMFYFSYLKLCF